MSPELREKGITEPVSIQPINLLELACEKIMMTSMLLVPDTAVIVRSAVSKIPEMVVLAVRPASLNLAIEAGALLIFPRLVAVVTLGAPPSRVSIRAIRMSSVPMLIDPFRKKLRPPSTNKLFAITFLLVTLHQVPTLGARSDKTKRPLSLWALKRRSSQLL